MLRLASASAATALALALVVIPDTRPAGAMTRTDALAAAANYGATRGYRVGIAVLDTVRHTIYANAAATSDFASESVVKVMIANRLLVQGRMSGTTARRAYKMITQSDDAIASSFYKSVGGDGLILWIKRRYNVWDLGSRPSSSNWWGNTHITARGLVRYYARMKQDNKVAPWLLNAMHHITRYGSDGTYQYFGLPSATTGAAVKQGWGDDYDDGSRSADFNTTGFVNGDRYAIAILARGPIKTYGKSIGGVLTQTAKLLLPGGSFPDPAPTLRSLPTTSGRTAGGQRIAIHGTDFTHVTAVTFGSYPGTVVRVFRPTYLHVTTPAHPAGPVIVRVMTTHGTTVAGTVRYTFVAPPAIKSIAPSSGPASGGSTVAITGNGFTGATQVLFGSQPAEPVGVVSSTSLSVVAPPGTPGTVDVRVVTPYGTSVIIPADVFTYLG
jgi:hypothetical protein